jgi:TolB-like protein
MAAGLLAAATTGIAYWIVRQSRTLDVVLPMAIAVAKFEAPDGDAELQQFATAAARSVADGLTRAGQRVVPVNLAVESAPREMRAAAPNPDAQILVNGYVSREHGRIRIVARLDHAKRAFTVWSNTLEGRLSEPGVMGQRLSAQIISKLDLTGPANLLNSDDPRDVERARTWLLIIQRSDDGDDRGAMEGTKRLIEIWPDEAHAYYSRTIETMDALPILSLAERTIEFRAAREAAQRALELDRLHPQESTGPFSAVARATPAYAWGERIKGLEDAIATGRTVPPVGWLADNYLEVGRVADALAKMGAQPIYGKTPLVTRARVLLALGDRTRAERDLRDGRDLWPLHPVFPELLFEAAAWLGSPDEAAGRLTEADPWSPTTAQRTLLSLFVASGRSARSDQAASIESRCASQASRRDEATLLDCLSALTILERRDAAFAVVDILFPDIRPKAGEDPDARWLAAPASSWNPDILYMPWTASLRADPRIIPVFERLGLLDYWRTSGAWPDFCEIEPLSVCSRMKSP